MKRTFTLIELLTVIVIFGVLSAIVSMNIKDTKSDSYIASIHSNVNSIQVAADTYRQKHKGTYPTQESPTTNRPQLVDFDKLYPDTLRTLPKTENIQYWIDHTGLVWATSLNLPNNLRYEGDGYVWDGVEGAIGYGIYELKEEEQIRVLGKVIKIRSPYKSLGTTKKNSFKVEHSTPILVSAIDKYDLETPPSALLISDQADSAIYKSELEDNIDTTLNGNQRPVAVIQTNDSKITTSTNLTWLNASYDPDNDELVDEEWINKLTIYPKAGTYDISLRVKDEKGAWSDWTTKTIEVKDPLTPPVAVIGFNPTGTIKTNTKITWDYHSSYDVNKLPIINAEWENAQEYYSKGVHTVRLRVQNSNGIWSEWVEKQIAVEVTNLPPTPVIKINPDKEITTETEVLFSSLSFDPNGDKIIKEEWANVKKQYPFGKNSVYLRVQDEKGLWSEWKEFSFNVLNPNQKPIAEMSIQYIEDEKKNKVFSFSSQGSYDKDGDIIVEEEWLNKKEQYSHSGKHKVMLRVKDSRGTWSDWTCKQIKVTGANKPAEITNCSP